MAFGSSFFRDFDEDPFFREAAPPRHMMDFGIPQRSIAGQQQRRQQARDPFESMLIPFGGGMMMDPFQRMQSMFADFENMRRAVESGHHPQTYSHSTMMHYSSSSNENGGQPQMYHATSSTVTGPGGVSIASVPGLSSGRPGTKARVKETRQSVKDSHSGLEKMAITHQIGDKSHRVEKKYNHKRNEREENQEFINLDETEAAQFSREWEEKTQPLNRALGAGSLYRGHQQEARTRGLPSGLPKITQERSHHQHHSKVHDPDPTYKGTSSRRPPYLVPSSHQDLHVDGMGVANEQQQRKKKSKVHF